MTDIPDDIMKAAREHFGAHADPYEDIARAIMAERERCAQIAEHLNGWGSCGSNGHAEHIARIIRKSP